MRGGARHIQAVVNFEAYLTSDLAQWGRRGNTLPVSGNRESWRSARTAEGKTGAMCTKSRQGFRIVIWIE